MHITIGHLSRSTGVNIETIRYYERIGLLPKAQRSINRRRYYSDPDVRRLAFIRHARELGFAMTAIRTLLSLQEEPETSCEEIAHIARDQLVAIRGRIKGLQGLRRELDRILNACAGGRVADCRIVEALSQPTKRQDR